MTLTLLLSNKADEHQQGNHFHLYLPSTKDIIPVVMSAGSSSLAQNAFTSTEFGARHLHMKYTLCIPGPTLCDKPIDSLQTRHLWILIAYCVTSSLLPVNSMALPRYRHLKHLVAGHRLSCLKCHLKNLILLHL